MAGDLSPEDYDMLLALDEQIAKKTVDQSEIDGYESRPVLRLPIVTAALELLVSVVI